MPEAEIDNDYHKPFNIFKYNTIHNTKTVTLLSNHLNHDMEIKDLDMQVLFYD